MYPTEAETKPNSTLLDSDCDTRSQKKSNVGMWNKFTECRNCGSSYSRKISNAHEKVSWALSKLC